MQSETILPGKLTNATVSAAVSVFHRESAQAIRPMMEGEVEIPPIPVAEGFGTGACRLVDANDLGARIAAEVNMRMPAVLAKACAVSHLPADAAKMQIERMLATRLREAAAGKNQEQHADWFTARHQEGFRAAIQVLLGEKVNVHFGPAGFVTKIRGGKS